MFEITLPCCDATVEVDDAAATIRCEACSIELDLASDARADAGATHATRELAIAA
jgi:hypothetical protein